MPKDMSKARAAAYLVNPTYKLTEQDRYHIAILVALRLYAKESIGKAYGVSRRTVANCYERYFGES